MRRSRAVKINPSSRVGKEWEPLPYSVKMKCFVNRRDFQENFVDLHERLDAFLSFWNIFQSSNTTHSSQSLYKINIATLYIYCWWRCFVLAGKCTGRTFFTFINDLRLSTLALTFNISVQRISVQHILNNVLKSKIGTQDTKRDI